MAVNDGNVEVVEPVVTEASGTAGVDTTTNVQPEPNQSSENPPKVEEAPHPAWLDQMPKDLKADKELMKLLSKNPTIGDYVRASYQKDGKPGEVETVEGKEPVQYEDFVKSLGVESDPFGLVGETLKTKLSNLGVTKEKAEEIFDSISEANQKTMKDFVEKGIPWCEGQLKDKWKDNYDPNHKAMNRATKALYEAHPELAEQLDRTGASINPAVAEAFAFFGYSIKEDGSVGSNLSGGGSGRSVKVPVIYPD